MNQIGRKYERSYMPQVSVRSLYSELTLLIESVNEASGVVYFAHGSYQ